MRLRPPTAPVTFDQSTQGSDLRNSPTFLWYRQSTGGGSNLMPDIQFGSQSVLGVSSVSDMAQPRGGLTYSSSTSSNCSAVFIGEETPTA
jgi:hypothetical protein